jgi:hypothetical protein
LGTGGGATDCHSPGIVELKPTSLFRICAAEAGAAFEGAAGAEELAGAAAGADTLAAAGAGAWATTGAQQRGSKHAARGIRIELPFPFNNPSLRRQ